MKLQNAISCLTPSFLVTLFLCSTDCETGPGAKGQLSKMYRPAFLCVSNVFVPSGCLIVYEDSEAF